jgi:hypothetical protein
MAAEHERWIVELVGGVTQHDRDALYRLLGTLKDAVGRAVARDAPVSAIASSRGGAR